MAYADAQYVFTCWGETKSLYRVDFSSGSGQRTELASPGSAGIEIWDHSASCFDNEAQKLYNIDSYLGRLHVYDAALDYWTIDTVDSNFTALWLTFVGSANQSSQFKDNSQLIAQNAISIGENAQGITDNKNDIVMSMQAIADHGEYIANNSKAITSNDFDVKTLARLLDSEEALKVTPIGLRLKGANLITRDNRGVVSIGANSLKILGINGRENLWATDASGASIPINIANGSDLQINGVSVQGQIDRNRFGIGVNRSAIDQNRRNINDLGFGVAGSAVLSAAMTALPTVASDYPLPYGVGTGGYSGRYAMSLGCAIRANNRLSLNLGGYYLFSGGTDYGNGSLSNVAGRSGFVFKIGTIQGSVSGSGLQSKLDDLEESNARILQEN